MGKKSEATEVRNKLFNDVKDWFAKKHKQTMSKSLFKQIFGSSIYSAHQGERECARRRRQYPSRDITMMGH